MAAAAGPRPPDSDESAGSSRRRRPVQLSASKRKHLLRKERREELAAERQQQAEALLNNERFEQVRKRGQDRLREVGGGRRRRREHADKVLERRLGIARAREDGACISEAKMASAADALRRRQDFLSQVAAAAKDSSCHVIPAVNRRRQLAQDGQEAVQELCSKLGLEPRQPLLPALPGARRPQPQRLHHAPIAPPVPHRLRVATLSDVQSPREARLTEEAVEAAKEWLAWKRRSEHPGPAAA
eukprot:TRINITY_DN8569_c0_g1_i1.p1 TRINITY_DN8569_c0_g1~~TRINITY_DN8569_c0_g1_i1.p1  ORF type:complete len:271 (+),score=104.00 TRINITY_DN8569_c0_g1_i1:87-815(+)